MNPDDVLAKIPMKQRYTTRYMMPLITLRSFLMARRCTSGRSKVRSIVIPLLDAFIEQKKMLVLLNEFSNTKDYTYHHSIAVGIMASAIVDRWDFQQGRLYNLTCRCTSRLWNG